MTPAQKGAAGVTALFLACATAAPMVIQWEGWERKSYADIVGVWTACAGTTRGVKPNTTYSDAQCQSLAARELVEYGAAIAPCLPEEMPVETRAAFVSAAYNIGTGAFCSSSMSRKAKAGDLRGACDALLLWNRAGGRVVKGLDNRRREERKLCLEGLA
jgi:lysozyme